MASKNRRGCVGVPRSLMCAEKTSKKGSTWSRPKRTSTPSFCGPADLAAELGVEALEERLRSLGWQIEHDGDLAMRDGKIERELLAAPELEQLHAIRCSPLGGGSGEGPDRLRRA